MKRLAQAILGLGISAVALWLTLRGKDLGGIWAAMRQADYRALPAYVAILLAIHLVRTWRWGILLEPVARIPFGRLNAVSAVGFMALMILPFRLGEFARPYLIAERPNLRVSSALSSIVVERVVDGIFTGLLLVVALLGIPDVTPGVHAVRVGGVIILAAWIALLAFLVVAYLSRALAVRIVRRLLTPISARGAERAASMLDAFIHGLRMFPGRGKLALFFGLTVAYWGLNAWGMQLLARGFGFELGSVAACTLLGILVVGVMIPAGPGMVGTFQGAIVLGLSLFAPRALVATSGVAYANVLWAAQLVQISALGIAYLFSPHVKVSRLWGAGSQLGEELDEEETEYRAAGDGSG